MNKFFAMALALGVSALLAGCSDAATEEEIAPAPVAATHSIFANILNDEEGDDTRAYVDNVSYQVKWETDDAISYFNDGDATPTQAILDPRYDGETYGMFKYNGNAVPENMDDYKTKYGVFPYNANDKAASGTINTELPAVQTYHERSFGGQNVYMTAFIPAASGGTLNFQSYHSGIGLELMGSGKGFKVIVTSEGTQNVAGKVSIPMPTNGGAPKAEVTNGSKSVTLDCSKVELTGEVQSFWIALLPGYYDKLRVRITNIAGTQEYFNKTVSKATFTQKKVKRFKVNDAINVVNIDHTKNPLLKWAETNLDTSTTTGFAENPWDTGEYFQFGRNAGYTNYNDAFNRYAVYCRQDTGYPNDVWGFKIWRGTQSPSQVEYSYCYGSTVGSDPASYFLINDTDVDGSANDWWPAREYMGDNWATRAKADGWSKADPSPEGWHIATTKEYNEIMPNVSGSSSSFLTNKGAIRTNEDCTYAIKWSMNYKTLSSVKRYLLLVEALVVEDGFTGDPINDVDWTDTNVVRRFFPSAGYIIGEYKVIPVSYSVSYGRYYFYYNSSQGYYLGQMRLARPRPAGAHNILATTDGSKVWLYTQSIVDYGNFRAAYWTADGGAFSFSYDLDHNYSDPYFVNTTKTYPKTHGMPLRCVANK